MHNRQDDLTVLALAAGRGNQRALEAFIRQTQDRVWRLHAHLSGRAVADDLTQETYLRAIRALPGFAGRSSALTWLLAIARRAGADGVRAVLAQPRTVSADWSGADPGPIQAGEVAEYVALHELIARLDPARREALLLTQVFGFSYAEVAEIVGCRVGTVRSRVARARDELVRGYAAGPVVGEPAPR